MPHLRTAVRGTRNALLAFAIAWASCAGLPRLDVESSRRVELMGLASVLRPDGEGWRDRKTESAEFGEVEFVKNLRQGVGAENGETALAILQIRRFDRDIVADEAYWAGVQKGIETSLSTDRLRPVRFAETRKNLGVADCLRYDNDVEDRGVPQFPNSVFILSSHGYICIHPSGGYEIKIEWSQRYLRGETASVVLELEGFLGSVQFLTPASASATPGRQRAVPSYSLGGQVWSATLSDPTSGPPRTEDSAHRLSYDNGGLELQVKQSSSYRIAFPPDPIRDVRVEAHLAFVTQVEVAEPKLIPNAGLMCRVTSGRDGFYAFRIWADGGFGVFRVRGQFADSWTRIATSSTLHLDHLKVVGELLMQIDCVGGDGSPVDLALAVDGRELLRVNDPEPGNLGSAGRVGLIVDAGDQPGFAARYSNAIVRQLTIRP